MRPVVCLVSAGHVAATGSAGACVARVRAAARAGVHLVQLREPRLDTRGLFDLTCACVSAVRGTPCRVVVNDRFDVALAAGAHGVHLRGDGPPAARLRAIAPPGFLIGRSVHGVEEAVACAAGGGLDYLLFGNVFPTASKPRKAGAGLDALAVVAHRVLLPVLAIGGMTAATVGTVARAGAAGFAAIAWFDAPACEALPAAVAAAAQAFDTPIARSLT